MWKGSGFRDIAGSQLLDDNAGAEQLGNGRGEVALSRSGHGLSRTTKPATLMK